nr:hypothetical protein [Tanacetum cinerariifolium]
MSLEELIAWEQEEAQSPSYLRLPHVWQRTSNINGKGKVLLDDFEAVGNGKGRVLLDDFEAMGNGKGKVLLDHFEAVGNGKGKTKQTEFEKYKAFNDRTIDYDKLERKLNETLGQLALKDIEIKEGLKTKAYELSVVKEKHDELIKQSLLTKSHYEGLVKQKTKTCLIPLAIKTQNDSFRFVHELKQEMHADLKYFESLEKKIDELKSDKAEFSNMYDVILQECISKDVIASNVFQKERKQYIKIQDLKAQLQDKNNAISELKKLIEKGKGKSVDTKFDKPSIVRQTNAQRISKPSVLGKSAPFSNSLERIYFSKTKSVPKANVSEGFLKPVTAQTLPPTARQAVSNTNVLKPGMYRIDNRTAHTRAPQLP